jgi:glycosyltransferase involved in cell wall biosynthesis
VSIVVPCFNEELVLPYLANTLRRVEEKLSQEYELYFIFVDDGSSDGTWHSLRQQFGAQRNCFLVRHPENRGVAAAILTGIRSAETDIVCSIDCDCTYDPHELKNMLPLLAEGVALVTASPYHPHGKVLNVPGWRLSLSKAASFLYRRVLPQRLYTYTSCFRVYRKKAIMDLVLREQGFLGIAELVGQLGLRNAQIVEHPAVLAVRVLGDSKMKVLRTVFGHLRLITRLLLQRVTGRKKSQESNETQPPALLSPTALVTVSPLLPAKEKLHE